MKKFLFYKIILFFFIIDADGELEHILPVCMDNGCVDSRIYVRDNNTVNKKD